MDESGLQFNNDTSQVTAKNGSKDVHVLKSTKRGKTIIDL
jgi:hypothetical protein